MPGKCRRKARVAFGSDAGRQRLCGIAGRNGHIAIRRNPHRELGIHQIEALGAKLAHQQRGAGQSHFGLRRACHDGVVAIPDNDAADTHRDTNPPRPLDLGAADLDGVAVTDIVLDRRCQPWRRHVEIDRTRAEPPPQRAETAGEDRHQRRDHDRDALYPALFRDPPSQRGEPIAEPMKVRV